MTEREKRKQRINTIQAKFGLVGWEYANYIRRPIFYVDEDANENIVETDDPTECAKFDYNSAAKMLEYLKKQYGDIQWYIIQITP